MAADETTKPPPTEFREHEAFDYSAFACPRCGATISGEHYGPCDSCRTELRASQKGEATGEASFKSPVSFAGRGGTRVRGWSSSRFPKKGYAFATWVPTLVNGPPT